MTPPETFVELAFKFVESMVQRADQQSPFPMWHGWALREAFLAGYFAASLPPNWEEKAARNIAEAAKPGYSDNFEFGYEEVLAILRSEMEGK